MHADYLETLTLYYEEEVEGEAYFAALAQAFDNPDHRAKLELLAAVERHAADSVASLIARYGLSPKPATDLAASGRKQARETPPDWDRLIAGMNDSYPGYLDAFYKLEAMAPPEDLRRLKFLTEHEVVALEFLALEAERPEASTVTLRAYLGTPPENWVPRETRT